MTWVQKVATVVPLGLSLLGWAGTTYLQVQELKARVAKEAGDQKILLHLAALASQKERPCPLSTP